MVFEESEKLRLEEEAREKERQRALSEQQNMQQEDHYAFELRLRRVEIRRMEHEDLQSFIHTQVISIVNCVIQYL